VNHDLAADHLGGMHWLCFHLEFEHPGDPDGPCASPTCHVVRAQLYAQALRDVGVDPHEVVRRAIAQRAVARPARRAPPE
jgi:hypothetical protein